MTVLTRSLVGLAARRNLLNFFSSVCDSKKFVMLANYVEGFLRFVSFSKEYSFVWRNLMQFSDDSRDLFSKLKIRHLK